MFDAWGENIGWIKLGDADHLLTVGPCGFGDYDCNGDDDLEDYANFPTFLGGPTVTVECSAFDDDSDTDVDLRDFARLQIDLSSP